MYLISIQIVVILESTTNAQFLGDDVIFDAVMHKACSVDITLRGASDQAGFMNLVVLYTIVLVGLVERTEKSGAFGESHIGGKFKFGISTQVRSASYILERTRALEVKVPCIGLRRRGQRHGVQ